MEFKSSVGLEVEGFGVVGGQKDEGVVQGVRVSGERKCKLRKIVNMNLRLVGACAHDPLTIFTYSDPGTGLLEFEILKQLDSVLVLGIILKTALSAAGKPVWERSRSRRAGYGVYRHIARIGELHDTKLVRALVQLRSTWSSASRKKSFVVAEQLQTGKQKKKMGAITISRGPGRNWGIATLVEPCCATAGAPRSDH